MRAAADAWTAQDCVRRYQPGFGAALPVPIDDKAVEPRAEALGLFGARRLLFFDQVQLFERLWLKWEYEKIERESKRR